MHHQNDRAEAKWLKDILQREGITCHLLFDVAGADLYTEMFRCADEADCVISLITQTLFDDEKCRKFHMKVYLHLQLEKYMAVRMAVEDRVFYSAAGGFLEGCHVLTPEEMTDDAFRECLVSSVNAIARRIPIIRLSDNHFQRESDNQPDVYRPTKSLNIQALSNSDEDEAKASQSQLSLTEQVILEKLRHACANQFSQSHVRPEDGNGFGMHQNNLEGGLFLPVSNETMPVGILTNPLELEDRHSGGQLLRPGLSRKFTLHRNEKPYDRFLRSPFLLPILSIDRLPTGYQITTHWMERGNLGQLLSEKKIETYHSSCLLRIIYQISAAVDFLHKRSVCHGNITPNSILIDEKTNARLGIRRDSRLNLPARNAPSTCTAKDTDIFMFGITVWQILKCTNDRKSLEDDLQALIELPEAEAMAAFERSIEGRLWQRGNEETLHLCNILLQCLTKPHKASMNDIKANIKGCITKLELPLIDFQEGRDDCICVYCMTEMPNHGLQASSPTCPQKCLFLNICPSCMPSICSSSCSCPQHESQIFPPFGGINSCALVISGHDQNDQEMQDMFYKDAFQISLTVAHPHIMAIPWDNIYHISPRENFTDDDIYRVVHEIVMKKPDFFLLYYSGHKATEGEVSPLDVSDEQGDALNVAQLRSLLMQPLTNTCPRLFVILDCCYAASLWSLLCQEQYTNDNHITFHTMWPSCGRKESSNISPNDEQSLFTKCLVSGLKGGRKCPNGTPSCQVCQKFINEISESRCISKKVLEEFVAMHMQRTFQEGRDDCQTPVIVESRRDSDPVIAYYQNQALYRFHFTSPKGQNFTKRVCELDSLYYDVDDVLQHLWNQLKDECLPNQLDYKTLQILRREPDDSVHELSELSDIIKTVFKNADSLYVSVRTDGEKLGYEKWVACFCDESKTKNAVRSLLALERNRQIIERHVKKVAVTEMSPTWKPADDCVFDQTFQKCWNSFLSLTKQRNVSFLQIEIRKNLSMFSIMSPQS